MANKEFQARHGLIVNTNLLIANVITGNVAVNGNVSISNTLVMGNTNIFQRANSLVFSSNGSDALVISPNTTGVMLEIINTSAQIRVFSVTDTGNVFANSNVNAQYYFGNGALLSGIITTVDLTPANNWANTLYTSALQNANNDANAANAYAATVGAASNTWANTKLANTSGVSFAGSLFFPTGNVGIKTASPVASLDVNGAIVIANTLEPMYGYQGIGLLLTNQQSLAVNNTASAQYYVGGYFAPRVAGSNTGLTYTVGTYNVPYIDSSNQSGRLIMSGQEIYAYRSSANDISTFATNGIWGLYIEAGHQSNLNANASTASVYGAQIVPENFRSNVTSMYGVNVNGYAGIVAGANTNTTNFYSLYTNLNVGASSGVGTDTVTNYYDAYLNGATVAARGTLTNRYGVYQTKSNHTNYFAGNVGIGTASPTYKLDVTGTGHITGVVTLDTALGVASGGTGINTLTGIVKGSGTSAFSAAVRGTDYSLLSANSAVASTSGQVIDFLNIPSGVKVITVMLNAVSSNGTSNLLVQIGDSGGIENSGYAGASTNFTNGTLGMQNFGGAGFTVFDITAATAVHHGHFTLTNISGNIWVCSGIISRSDTTRATVLSGTKTLSATLDRVRITTNTGFDVFDAGSINIFYEY